MADEDRTSVHRIHADALEYTRSGLKLRRSIQLQVGAHNRVVIVRPQRVEAVTLPGFDFDSAFPAAPLAGLLADRELVRRLSSLPDGAVVQMLGHANLEDNLDHNKKLSEQRAKAVAAIVGSDGEGFAQLARECGWGLAEHQALLRIIGFDPGPIDGATGPMTRAAIKDFQHCVNTGALEATPASLPESGTLDGSSVESLYSAFVTASSPTIGESALHPTHATAGCTEHNAIAPKEEGHTNRRVTLAIRNELPPEHDAAPCTDGDHQICPVTEPHGNCMWYREHYTEQRDNPARFFDFQWLRRSDTEAMLSVLTTLPSGSPVEFQVWREVGDFDGTVHRHQGSQPVPTRGIAVGEPISGTVRNGVAFAHWQGPDADWSPFDVDDWFPDAEEGSGLRPPLFSIRHSTGWAFSTPPGIRLDRLLFSERTAPGSLVMTNLGKFMEIPPGVLRVGSFDHVRFDEHVQVAGGSIRQGFLAPKDESAEP